MTAAQRPTALGLARAGLVVSGAFLASRVLGYARTVIVGTTFGAGPDLDAFFAAFRIPDLIYQLVAAGALASALIPVAAGLLATGERARAWRLVGSVANVLLAILAVLAVIAFILAPALVRILAPGYSEATLELTARLTRLMLVSPILLSLGAVATSALNAVDRFTAAAIAPILYNVAIIAAALLFGSSMGVTALALGVVVGSLLTLLVQIPSLRAAGFRPHASIDLDDPAARRVLVLLAPRAIGLGASQITFIVMTALASGLGAGAVSAYTIAFALLQIPIGIIGVPLGVVVFPAMARGIATGATRTYVALVTRSVRLLVYVMLPITAIGIALTTPTVELLFGYGKFDAEAIGRTAATLGAFLAGLAAHSAIAVLARAFYARQDTRTPVIAAIVAVVVNCGLGVVFVGPFGLPGLAAAIAIAAWVEAAILLVLLERSEGSFELVGILRVLIETELAAIAGAIVARLVLGALGAPFAPGAGKLAILAGTTLASVAGGAAFLLASLALRIPELPSIVGLVTDLLRRRGRA